MTESPKDFQANQKMADETRNASNNNNNSNNDQDDAVFRTPSELSLAEFGDLLDQIRSADDVSLDDCHEELMDGARYNDIDVVRAILYVYPTAVRYQRSQDGNTALHMAAANGHYDIVELLLLAASRQTRTRLNDDHDGDDDDDSSASFHLHLIPNTAGNTALHWAAANGKTKIVKRLLREPGVDVLLKNAAGRSILTEGFTSQCEAVIAALLEHDTATEERLLDSMGGGTTTTTTTGTTTTATSGKPNEAGESSSLATASVTHQFRFGEEFVLARELAIPSSLSSSSSSDTTNNNSNGQDYLSIIGQAASTDDLTGYAIWASSLVMADWLSRLGPDVFKNCTVLELGAGCGVPSLVVASFRQAKIVYSTDWNQTVVDNLQYNVELNIKQSSSSSDDDGGPPLSPLSVHTMNWQVPSTWPISKVDILIGSDLIY
jgi:Lysine methyltransferase/Ankyrin repeats (3 copies)/Ankyrin repeats (many copies)